MMDVKAELLESLLISVKGFACSTRGANALGASSEVYIAKKSKICIKAGNGEVYFVAVQKSPWRHK